MSAAPALQSLSGVLVPFGPEKGAPIEKASRQALELAARTFGARAQDPAKVEQLTENRRSARAVLDEVKRRDTPPPAPTRAIRPAPAPVAKPADGARGGLADEIVHRLHELHLLADCPTCAARGLPAHDLDAERVVLSHRLIPGLDVAVFADLAAEDFFTPWHQALAAVALPPAEVKSVDELVATLDEAQPYSAARWRYVLGQIHDRAPALARPEAVRDAVERVIYLADLRELSKRLQLLDARIRAAGELSQPRPAKEARANIFQGLRDLARPFYQGDK